MLIDLTVRGPHGDRDVRLDLPADAVVGSVRSALARCVGLPADSRLFLDNAELADSHVLAAAGLRSGSVVGVEPTPARRTGRPYSLRVTGGPAAGRVHPLQRGRVTIGRGGGCDIALDDERVSRRHATLEVAAGQVTVLDHGSTNGSTVDGWPVPRTGAPLPAGAVLQVGDSLLSVAAPTVDPAAVSLEAGSVLVPRPPRPARPGAVETVILPGQPVRERPPAVQLIAALLPALAAGALAWITGSTVFLLFGLLSPAMLVSTALGDRWQGRRARRRAETALRATLDAACAALAAALETETGRRRAEFPDPAVVALVAELPGASIWARRPGDDDWFVLRVGCGAAPSRTLVRDGGPDRPGGLLKAVPVTVDLRAGPVGLAGPTAVRTAMARWWVAQLAVHHSPGDVSVVVLTADESWAWVRWLPHARVVTTERARAELLEQLAAEVEHRLRRTEGGGGDGPATVLVVDGAAEPTFVDLVARGTSVGLTAIWLRADPGSLPGRCTTVVAAADGRVRIGDAGRDSGPVDPGTVADTVTSAWCDQVARSLAPFVDARARSAGRLPDACSLTGLLGFETADAAEIARAWERSSGRADTVLGRTVDAGLSVDLVADGPHALVAGTTGSGKSELLRTFVAGLCSLHPPDELTVLLVDYKGGAAFAECADLPHCAGLVTDLDPHLTARALRSLDAEIRRREELLHAAGAVDLEAYRAVPSTEPLARLVIVVDEFATLAEDLPDFVTGLVGVAQRGRSLGVHLVLATQRPGSVVSPQIRANTSLRIALRVTDAADSLDVVDTDDAAAIAPSTPGRAVLRDGSGLRVFQTARPTITPSRASTPQVRRLDVWRRPDPDDEPAARGLGALVGEVVQAARATGRVRAPSPWLPPLDDLMIAPVEPGAAFAVVDLPGRQRRPYLELSLDPPSSTLVLGAARSGRTTALAAFALAAARPHPVDEIEIHVLDAQGALIDLIGGLPQLGTCLGPDDVELADALLDRLTDAPGRRRHLLLVDGWDLVLGALGDTAAVVTGQRLVGLLRAPGRTTVTVSGDRSLAAPRVSGAFDQRLVLRMSDPLDYGALGLSARDVPVSFPPGRGLRAQDGAEFQVVVPRPAAGATVADAIRAAACDVAVTAPPLASADVLRIRALPRSVPLADLAPVPARRLRIGLGGDDASPVTLDPFAGSRRWIVCGPPRSGRSGVLCVVLVEAVRVGCPVLVAAPSRSPLAGLAIRLGVALLDPADPPGNGVLRDGPPMVPTLLLVDDTDAFLDTDVGDTLLTWVRDTRARLSVLASGLPDEVALAYRGLAAEVRRSRSGIVLHPGPVDGELLGVHLPRARAADPPGRGRLVGDPAWLVGSAAASEVAAAVRIQVATVDAAAQLSPCGGSGDPCPTRTSP